MTHQEIEQIRTKFKELKEAFAELSIQSNLSAKKMKELAWELKNAKLAMNIAFEHLQHIERILERNDCVVGEYIKTHRNLPHEQSMFENIPSPTGEYEV